MEINKIYNENCLIGMQKIPDGIIDLVLCDPPYGTIKNINLKGYNNINTFWDNQLDTKLLFKEYERVLRENGQIILFSQEPYTSKLRNNIYFNIEFCYPLIWEKNHFANNLIANKAPVSYFEDISVFYKKYDTYNLNPLRKYFKELLEFLKLSSCKDINKLLQHRKGEHCFYIDSIQFKLCTEQVYNEMINKLNITKFNKFKSYNELQIINKKYKKIFNLPNNCKIKSNILKYKKDSEKLHTTQKPIKLLEDLLLTYSNEHDLILDNCIGSGSTAIAAINTKRNYIGFELNENYFTIAEERIKNYKKKLF